jgi:hypothetical protein
MENQAPLVFAKIVREEEPCTFPWKMERRFRLLLHETHWAAKARMKLGQILWRQILFRVG